jgi:hypothetical protein
MERGLLLERNYCPPSFFLNDGVIYKLGTTDVKL